jgi:LEA14-like dessication related protein
MSKPGLVRRGAWRRARGRMATAGALLALAGTVGACATLGRAVFEEPVVNFRALRVNGLGLTGGALDVELSVFNPNGYNLESTSFTYNLLMDTVRVADGLIETRQTFRSGDSTVVTIPVNFTYAGLGRAGAELIRSGTVNYRVLGNVTVATPVGNFTLPYDQTRRFSPLRGSTPR